MFDWEDLRHFLAVAQAGTLSGAARRLKVDHATVSRRLTALETALQMRLIDRLPRSCRLTLMGEQIFHLASQMEASAFAIERVVHAARSPFIGKVTVSAPPVLATNFFAKQVFTFRKRHPDIQLSIASQTQQVSLSRREADIAVRLSRPTEASSVTRRLGVMTFALYASRDYAYRHQPAIWEFIAYDAQYADMPHQHWLLAVAGSRPIVCEVSDITSQHVAARTGIGVAGLPCFLGDADPTLERLPFDGDAFSREIWLVVHADLKHSASIRTVTDFIVDSVSKSDLGPALL
ncbi:LysR family transcriptional regulator [Nguyenibacter vanlangensis]|uniref:LysR family transcriptional regulator n=1 Tax=Nguyenibacter vanlangensis TaxID=1216886 RepID=A0A7Y7IU66_9PROT|nr:LysR family transcriptional regulator [Nguyenibacter vanlangensis]NVN10469.1 LysR family transcriptional regulator [Nguyenibacter vanlangensis]